MIKKQLFLAVFTATILAGCGTKVPITERAAVIDRAPQPVAALAQPALVPAPVLPASPAPREVAPVEVAPVDISKLKTIYFDFDSFVVKPEFQAALEAQAKVLMANRQAKVSLVGHTDDLGGREYNLALGQKRADAVKRSLTIFGVSDAQMEAISFGKEKLASAGSDEVSRAKNRRVEFAAP